MPDAVRVLIIEDNEDLAFGLRTNLEVEGYEVLLAATGPDGLRATQQHRPDLVILDLMLPDLSGIEVLKKLRDSGTTVPILILTARGEEVDKVMGLRLGADDYVTKPFGLMELMARVEALLRRADDRGEPVPGVQIIGDIEVDRDARLVRRAGRPVELTPKEYGLLLALLDRNGAVATRLELMGEVWGHSSAVVSRTVDTHIAELRRKLENDPAKPRHILTVRKTGYRFQSPG